MYGCGVEQRLVAQRASQDVGERRHLITGRQRFGAGELMGVASVSGRVGKHRGRDRGDVAGVDRRDGDVAPRRAHEIALTELGQPAQRV